MKNKMQIIEMTYELQENQNIDRLLEKLNARKNPRRLYEALLGLIEPGLEDAEHVIHEREVGVRELLGLVDAPHSAK